METIYNVDYFIKKFEAIHEVFWWVGSYHNDARTKFCAAGHCGGNSDGLYSKEGYGLYLVICELKKKITIADINDGKSPLYQQPTPKQRILAALYDIKKLQEPKVEGTKIVYVTVDSAVRELQEKVLSEN